MTSKLPERIKASRKDILTSVTYARQRVLDGWKLHQQSLILYLLTTDLSSRSSLQTVMNNVREASKHYARATLATLEGESVAIATYAAHRTSADIRGAFSQPAINDLRLFGKQLSVYMDDIAAKHASRVNVTLRSVQRSDLAVNVLRGTPEMGFHDGVLTRAEVSLRLVANTYLLAAASRGMFHVLESNPDKVSSWRFAVEDDHRHTGACGVLEGATFPLFEGPSLPQHFNCRSYPMPVLRDG